jgi:hypothetical protein
MTCEFHVTVHCTPEPTDRPAAFAAQAAKLQRDITALLASGQSLVLHPRETHVTFVVEAKR